MGKIVICVLIIDAIETLFKMVIKLCIEKHRQKVIKNDLADELAKQSVGN